MIGNGDVTSPEKAKEMLEQTGCDAVMIGRGAKGNPWIFRQIAHYLETGEKLEKPDIEEVKQMMMRHARMQMEYKGGFTGIREMRKHVAWYTQGLPHAARLRREVNRVEAYSQLEELMTSLVD